MARTHRGGAPVGLAAALQAILAAYSYLGRRMWRAGR